MLRVAWWVTDQPDDATADMLVDGDAPGSRQQSPAHSTSSFVHVQLGLAQNLPLSYASGDLFRGTPRLVACHGCGDTCDS